MVFVAVACACRVGVVSVACEWVVMIARVLGLLKSESVVSVVHGLGSESHQGQRLGRNVGIATFQACPARTARVRARVRVHGQVCRVRRVVDRVAGAGMADVAVGGNGGALGSDRQLEDRFSRRFMARTWERPGR
jgi:hypothetical protein